MARGDVLLVELPNSDKREERGNRPAIAVQSEVAASPMLMIVPVTSSLRVYYGSLLRSRLNLLLEMD
jgi:mRNA interferase MazF